MPGALTSCFDCWLGAGRRFAAASPKPVKLKENGQNPVLKHGANTLS